MALDIISTTTGKKLNVKNGRTKSDEDKRRDARKRAKLLAAAKARARTKEKLKKKEPKLKKGGTAKRQIGGTTLSPLARQGLPVLPTRGVRTPVSLVAKKGGAVKRKKGGTAKRQVGGATQGYDARLDERLGMTGRPRSATGQTYAQRRAESRGARTPVGSFGFTAKKGGAAKRKKGGAVKRARGGAAKKK